VALFAAGATRRRHQLIMAFRSIVPGAVGDMGPPGMACHDYGYIEACPFPSSVRSLTLGLSFYICGGLRQCGPPAGPAPSPEGDRAPLGSGEAEIPFSGSGEARPVLKGP
jgi:hypothetical protein